jgi:signal transduction histidine kinase
MRLPHLSFHTRLTLTIAGAFIGAMAVILIVALFAVRSLDLGVVSMSYSMLPSVETPVDPETPEPVREMPVGPDGEVSDPPDPADPADPVDEGLIPGAVYVVDEGSDGSSVTELKVDRLPTLTRWSLIALGVFAVIAIAIASWISKRSLGRIAGITQLAQGLSEHHLDQRLNLSGPNDEIKQLGDTFDGMLDRLQRVFANQQLFVANASHELRTPLTTARVALEIPLAQDRVPDDLRPAIERALAANARSEDLIAGLLVLAQGSHAGGERTPVDLAELVLSAVEQSQSEARQSGITFHTTLAEVTIEGHPTLLNQAIQNLVQNAVRHNVPTGDVWISTSATADTATLLIANTGAAYEAATVQRLREPFHRHDTTRLATGTGFGLGLAIADSVVAMHSGTLSIRARAGGGLDVNVRFPVVQPAPADSPSTTDDTAEDGA